LGPEYLRRSFEAADDSDLNEAAGQETIEAAMRRIHQQEAAGNGVHHHSDPEDIKAGGVQQQA
jgi:SHS family lactate transporter-like MFS transporter